MTNTVKKRTTDILPDSTGQPNCSRHQQDNSSTLAAAVRSKLEDGNIKAAVRIICSDKMPAPNKQAILDALRRRHPSAPVDQRNLPNISTYSALQTNEDDIIKAIQSFPVGSSAGPDGLRPQHLLDLIKCLEAGNTLVTAITKLIILLLDGRCPSDVAAVLFGGLTFCAQQKVWRCKAHCDWLRVASPCGKVRQQLCHLTA
jgi:hypothetical protein